MELNPRSLKSLLQGRALLVRNGASCHIASCNINHHQNCDLLGLLFSMAKFKKHANLVHLKPKNIGLELGIELNGAVKMTWCIALLDGVDFTIGTMKILNGCLNRFTASTILEYLDQDLFSWMSQVAVEAICRANCCMTMH